MRRSRLLMTMMMLSFCMAGACDDTPETYSETQHSAVSEQILRLQNSEEIGGESAVGEDTPEQSETQALIPADTPRAEGPPRPFIATIESRDSRRPEVGCEVRYGDSVAYSGNDGTFSLDAVRSGGTVRLRMSCRGHIERQRVVVPDGVGTYELETPLIVGPRTQRTGGRSGDASSERVSISDAIRQMDEERLDNDGNPSILRTTARGLTNLIGTAAAVSTAGEDDRYRVLGQWKRAEEEAAAQAAANEGVEHDADAQHAPASSREADTDDEQQPETAPIDAE